MTATYNPQSPAHIALLPRMVELVRECEAKEVDPIGLVHDARFEIVKDRISGRMPATREEFLRHVGDYRDGLNRADELEHEADLIWEKIKYEFHTKAGKPRKTPPSDEAQHSKLVVAQKRSDAAQVRRYANEQKRTHDNEQSHLMPHLVDRWMPQRGAAS